MDFAKKLKNWYATKGRNLPWREVSDPYKIWISEIILQQTRIDQGLDYYLRFIGRFPDVHCLASAPEDEILKLWQGLGYYARARNMHFTAKSIVARYNGKFPETYNELITLKGVGPYTAAAIASIAFGQATSVIDGNVLRVISRWFAIDEAVDTGIGKKMIGQALEEIFDHEDPGTFNQAIMDFGAMVCKPKNPTCSDCPFSVSCAAFNQNLVGEIPRKSKSIKQLKRYFHYLVITFLNDEKFFTLLKKRNEKDIWGGLYEFPVIETDAGIEPDGLMNSEQWKELFAASEPEMVNISKTYKHQLTHQQLFAVFYHIRLAEPIPEKFKPNLVKMKDLHSFPVPRLIDRYLTEDKAMQHILKDFYPNSDYKS
jgi:A/G-specific adenine glycosylase